MVLPAVLATRLGIEGLVDRMVDLGGSPGATNPGRNVMTLISDLGDVQAYLPHCSGSVRGSPKRVTRLRSPNHVMAVMRSSVSVSTMIP